MDLRIRNSSNVSGRRKRGAPFPTCVLSRRLMRTALQKSCNKSLEQKLRASPDFVKPDGGQKRFGRFRR
jgi:hypothetical protein